MRSVRYYYFFRSRADGECKVQGDADVSGALDLVGIEDVDSGP